MSKREFEIGGGWGDAVGWTSPKEFDTKKLDKESVFSCHGWKAIKPKVGDHLRAEFKNSWMTFKFIEVKIII